MARRLMDMQQILISLELDIHNANGRELLTLSTKNTPELPEDTP